MKTEFKPDQIKLLTLCGVPRGLTKPFTILRSPFYHLEDGDPPVWVSLEAQKKSLEKVTKFPIQVGNFCFYSVNSFELARQFIVTRFYNNVHYCKTNFAVSKGVFPIWYYIDSSFECPLIDMLQRKDSQQAFDMFQPLIVVDGLNTLQSNARNDRTRDIINLSGSHPLILLMNGPNPLKFLKETIGITKMNFVRIETAPKEKSQ